MRQITRKVYETPPRFAATSESLTRIQQKQPSRSSTGSGGGTHSAGGHVFIPPNRPERGAGSGTECGTGAGSAGGSGSGSSGSRIGVYPPTSTRLRDEVDTGGRLFPGEKIRLDYGAGEKTVAIWMYKEPQPQF